MTIHDTHPFADPDPDPVRRFRGRLGGAVALVTAGDDSRRAGLTVSSLMVANGDPAQVILLVDPDSDLHDVLADHDHRAVVQLLSWRHRDLAEAFAGTAPAPGGPFRTGEFETTAWGPRLVDATTWMGVRLEVRTDSGLVVAASLRGRGDPRRRGRRAPWQPARTVGAVVSELLEIADRLYGLSLPEFTPARDARVKELKGTPLAASVKSLRKPSTAAWVVNLLVRRETEQVEQVLAVGAALREAQASMSGEELRALTRQRRQLTAAVTTQARKVAKEAGTRVTEAVADQVEATLTAAMIDERCGLAVRSGLLVSALTTTGLDPADVAAAVALPDALGFAATATARADESPARPDLHVVPDPEADAKAIAAAEETLAEAESDLAQAQATYDEAAAAVAELEARGLQLQAEIDELRGRIAELESQAEESDDELTEAEDARAEAEHARSESTRARDAAQAALEKLY